MCLLLAYANGSINDAVGVVLNTLGGKTLRALLYGGCGGWGDLNKDVGGLKDTMLPRACALRWFGQTWRGRLLVAPLQAAKRPPTESLNDVNTPVRADTAVFFTDGNGASASCASAGICWYQVKHHLLPIRPYDEHTAVRRSQLELSALIIFGASGQACFPPTCRQSATRQAL